MNAGFGIGVGDPEDVLAGGDNNQSVLSSHRITPEQALDSSGSWESAAFALLLCQRVFSRTRIIGGLQP